MYLICHYVKYVVNLTLHSCYPCAYLNGLEELNILIDLLIQVLNSGAFSISHPTSQDLLGANFATGPVLKEHLSARSYSQTGFPGIPQGHTYTPSALQQAYPGGNMFHESYTGTKYDVPQYRNANMSSLLSSGSYTAYQNLGNSAHIPNSFMHNQSVGPADSKVGYNDLLRARYRNGGDNLNQLQQVVVIISIF